jgi:hypothetical protein
MTEDTGFPSQPGPIPAADDPLNPVNVPPLDSAPAEAVSEPQVEVQPGAEPEAVADHVPPPFIPSEGVAGWLRDLLLDFHQRLRNAGF